VFEQQHRIADRAGLARGDDALLERESFGEGDAAKG
jgi:hypothetical protein